MNRFLGYAAHHSILLWPWQLLYRECQAGISTVAAMVKSRWNEQYRGAHIEMKSDTMVGQRTPLIQHHVVPLSPKVQYFTASKHLLCDHSFAHLAALPVRCKRILFDNSVVSIFFTLFLWRVIAVVPNQIPWCQFKLFETGKLPLHGECGWAYEHTPCQWQYQTQIILFQIPRNNGIFFQVISQGPKLNEFQD